MRKRSFVEASIIVAVLLFCGFGLVGLVTGGSAGGSLPTGRTVMTFSDSIYLSNMMESDTATIKTSGKTIVVRPKSIEINGAEVASIDEATKKIEVHVKWGKVKFIADGQPVDVVRK